MNKTSYCCSFPAILYFVACLGDYTHSLLLIWITIVATGARVKVGDLIIRKGDICFNTPLELPPQPRLTGGYHNRIESLGTDSQLILTSRVWVPSCPASLRGTNCLLAILHITCEASFLTSFLVVSEHLASTPINAHCASFVKFVAWTHGQP